MMGTGSMRSLYYHPMRLFSNYPDHTSLEMPNLSPTMQKGNLTKWRKAVGDKVEPGDIIAEIETDKATIDFEMQEEGYVAKLVVSEGTNDIPLGNVVAILVEEEADIAAFKDYTPPSKAAPAPAAEAPKAASKPSSPAPAASKAPGRAAPGAKKQVGDRVYASVIARREARDKGLDLGAITGTGPNGRIILADVESFLDSRNANAMNGGPADLSTAVAAYDDIELTQMRKVIASRLTESKQTIPHFYTTVEAEVNDLMELRKKLNSHSKSKISINDLVIKATSLAALKVPSTNSAWHGEFVRQYKNVDMSIAVSTPTGLITPIVKNINHKGLEEISQETKSLAFRAKEGLLQPHEFMGGTFTTSNMGMFGVDSFSAIINPPQSCILAIAGAKDQVLPNPGGAEPYRIAKVLTVTLSADHRVVDGADAAVWTQHFKKLIENPELMLL